MSGFLSLRFCTVQYGTVCTFRCLCRNVPNICRDPEMKTASDALSPCLVHEGQKVWRMLHSGGVACLSLTFLDVLSLDLHVRQEGFRGSERPRWQSRSHGFLPNAVAKREEILELLAAASRVAGGGGC